MPNRNIYSPSTFGYKYRMAPPHLVTHYSLYLSLSYIEKESLLSPVKKGSLSHLSRNRLVEVLDWCMAKTWTGAWWSLGLVRGEVLDWCATKSWTGAQWNLGLVHGEILGWCAMKSWASAWRSLGLVRNEILDWCTTKSCIGAQQSLGLVHG